jgi:hypothetical protein
MNNHFLGNDGLAFSATLIVQDRVVLTTWGRRLGAAPICLLLLMLALVSPRLLPGQPAPRNDLNISIIGAHWTSYVLAGVWGATVGLRWRDLELLGGVCKRVSYKSNYVAATAKTNDNSAKTKTITVAGIAFTYRVGKQLADAPASAFSATSNTLIVPTTGYTPNGGDWVLLDEGFCELLYDGYDRMAISLVELDGGLATTREVFQDGMLSLPYDKKQWAKQRYDTDRWATWTLEPLDFDGDNEVFLIKTSGLYDISQTQPGNATSWLRLQRF